MKSLQELKDLREEREKALEMQGPALIRREFVQFFKENESVLGIQFIINTPHEYDDQDHCCNYETVGKFHVKIFGEDDYPAWNLETTMMTPKHRKCFAEAEELRGRLLGLDFEDAAIAVFGDGMRVTATPEGFTTEEWNHDSFFENRSEE